MNNERYPVLITEIGDLCIRSVLDNGFVQEAEMAPEVHVHAFYELMLAIDGEFRIEIRDKSAVNEPLVMKAGSVCLIPPGVYHCTRGVSEAPVKLALRFNCTPSDTARSGRSIFELCTRTLASCQNAQMIQGGERLCLIIREIRCELNSERLACAEYVRLLLSQLYINLFRELDRSEASTADGQSAISPVNDTDVRQIQIEEYMLSHYGEPLTEEELAREMNLSKRQLSRVLRRLFGMSFRKMLIDIRLNRAAQLLTESDLSVEEIAQLVGYTSLSGFYAAFRNRFSLSVGQYRQAFSGKN